MTMILNSVLSVINMTESDLVSPEPEEKEKERRTK